MQYREIMQLAFSKIKPGQYFLYGNVVYKKFSQFKGVIRDQNGNERWVLIHTNQEVALVIIDYEPKPSIEECRRLINERIIREIERRII
jgi:hypothetical protein